MFIAVPPPSKKPKKSSQALKLFDGFTFYVIPENTMSLCALPRVSVTSSGVDEENSQDESGNVTKELFYPLLLRNGQPR